jgi:hypothetical protein
LPNSYQYFASDRLKAQLANASSYSLTPASSAGLRCHLSLRYGYNLSPIALIYAADDISTLSLRDSTGRLFITKTMPYISPPRAAPYFETPQHDYLDTACIFTAHRTKVTDIS